MDSTTLINFAVLVICLALSAFFSSSETAFMSLSRVRLRHLVDEGAAGAMRVFRMVENPDRFLITVLVGNTLVNTAMAAVATVIAVSLFGPDRGALIATVAVTIVLVTLGEALPKVMGARHAERVTLVNVVPLEIAEKAFYPITWLLHKLIWAVAGPSVKRQPALVSAGELRAANALGREGGAVEHTDAEMLHAILEFRDRQVREIMTPRNEIVPVEEGAPLQEFLALYKACAHTRFPVYEGGLDNITGILSVKDVLRAMAEQKLTPDSPVTRLVKPAYFVPETKQVTHLFQEMRARGTSMAIVVDEFGGVAGLLSVTQLVEEIVGPLGDGQLEPEFKTIDDKTFQIEGGMRIDEANEQLGLGLPEGDYETVAGFVMATLGHVPQQGEQLRHDSFKLVVTQMDGVKIQKVLVTRSP
ncbi:MAG: hemolysin family protein [Chloroflexota bacterium]